MVIDHYLFMVRTMIAEGKQSVASFGTNNLFLFKTNACVNGSWENKHKTLNNGQ